MDPRRTRRKNSDKQDKDPMNKLGEKQEKNLSKGQVGDKLKHLVLLFKAMPNKLSKEFSNYTLFIPALVSEKLKICGSLGRAALWKLFNKRFS